MCLRREILSGDAHPSYMTGGITDTATVVSHFYSKQIMYRNENEKQRKSCQ